MPGGTPEGKKSRTWGSPIVTGGPVAPDLQPEGSEEQVVCLVEVPEVPGVSGISVVPGVPGASEGPGEQAYFMGSVGWGPGD
jgi:hypothetical protein